MIGQILESFIMIQVIYLGFLFLTNFSAMMLTLLAFRSLLYEYLNFENHMTRNVFSHEVYRPVSILAPAYNEEVTIVQSVASLLQMNFPKYEVIVINDGSTDGTLRRIAEAYDLYPAHVLYEAKLESKPIRNVYRSRKYSQLVVVDKENGGKADALNAGISVSTYPFFCSIDADSLLYDRAMTKALDAFIRDRRVVAVGGTIGVLNGSIMTEGRVIKKRPPPKLIEKFQAVEYLRGFMAGRTGWQTINGLLIVSGAFGVFRKDLILSIGGYRHTIGEDFDLLVRLRKYCYDHDIEHRVAYIPETMSWTQVPDDYGSLMKQRNRWQRGLLETLFYNRKMIFNPKYGVVGLVSLPYFIFVEALGPMITFIGVVSLIVLYLFGVLDHRILVLFFLLEFGWGLALNVMSLFLDLFTATPYTHVWEIVKLISASFIEPFFYRPLIKMEQFIAGFNFFNSGWGEIKRKSM